MKKCLVVLLMLFAACVGKNQQSVVDAIEEEFIPAGGDSPFVEAFFEFPGPPRRWSGPGSFTLHVSAREGARAEIRVIFPMVGKKVIRRGLASKETMGMAVAKARERLAVLALVLQEAKSEEFRGCMHPVRVRLVQANGSVVERHSCRSELGWANEASFAVSAFLASL